MTTLDTAKSARSRDARKKLGIYYTPDELTAAVADWAIRSPDDIILEPSFGGCGFLVAAQRRLMNLGCRTPLSRLFGSDIDGDAFLHLDVLFNDTQSTNSFVRKDFLATTQRDWPSGKFDVVLGNPPYISHHNMTACQKTAARQVLKGMDVKLAGTSSLWAYFVLHAMSFLNEGGRLAFILPDSFLSSNYAGALRAHLFSHFGSVVIARKCFRMFMKAGTSERTLILLADGYSRTKCRAEIQVAPLYAISELRAIINNQSTAKKKKERYNLEGNEINLQISSAVYNLLMRDPRVFAMQDLLDLEIGLVTGANKIFVINEETRKKWRLPRSAVLPILSRTADAPGILLSIQDHENTISQGKRGWLFRPKNLGRRHGAIRRYLASVPRKIRRDTAWFRKRERWYSPDGYKVPDAFLTYMNHTGPRLLLNEGGLDCTNTLHRANFKKHIGKSQRKLIAVSFLTSFAQISAELCGRSYGGGVLKLEPSEFRDVKLILPKRMHPRRIDRIYRAVDSYLRAGDADAARKAADDFILGEISSANRIRDISEELESTLGSLRAQRRISAYL